ncbi:MAG: hypothetical protein AAGH78_10750 [Cyanobacteria bacterium P01_H01_bin.58]
MTPSESLAVDQERVEANEAAAYEWAQMGESDATLGRLPEYANDAYLAGYTAKLKQLPADGKGRIIHYQPEQHFAWGLMDTPEQTRAADEF